MDTGRVRWPRNISGLRRGSWPFLHEGRRSARCSGVPDRVWCYPACRFRQLRAASGQKTSTIWFVFAIAIVIIGAFWATALYAQSAGESAGAGLAAGKTSNPAATVYSTTQLPMLGGRQLPLAPSTNTTPASPAPEKQWRYVYSGYRVLAFTGNGSFWCQLPTRRR